MKVALVGLPQSGKTSLFQALTGSSGHSSRGSLNLGTVKVPDPRVDRLAEIYRPKRRVYATVEVVEANTPAATGERRPGQSALNAAFLNLVKPMDAFLLVLRAFDEEGLCDPRADLRVLLDEMAFADLLVLESRLERDEADRKKGKPGMAAEEREALLACQRLLNDGRRIVEDESLARNPWLRAYAFLTARPAIAVLNVRDEDAAAGASVRERFGLQDPGLPCFPCSARLEAEVAELPEEDRPAFLQELGISEPAVNVVLREVYQALGLVSFLTAGEDECRAWPIRRGTLAPQAAGVVHSDIEKGFIRAEVISYDDFIALGSEAAARKAGRYRLEGRDYAVQDGDIVHFRFHV